MGTTHQEVGQAHARQNAAIGHATGVAVALLAVYLLGYAVLSSLDYFDLARLPYAPHTDDWLYQLYRPLEWLSYKVERVRHVTPNKPAAANPAMASELQAGRHWRGVAEPES